MQNQILGAAIAVAALALPNDSVMYIDNDWINPDNSHDYNSQSDLTAGWVKFIGHEHQEPILSTIENLQRLDPLLRIQENNTQEVRLNLLPSDVEFSPSIALAEFWIDGIKFIRESASLDVTDINILTDIDIQSVRKLFSDRLFQEIISHLQNSRINDRKKQLSLIVNDTCEPWLEWLLSNTFEIRPRSMEAFIKTAELELIKYFCSVNLKGDWGEIVAHRNNSIAELLPARPFTVRARNSSEIDI